MPQSLTVPETIARILATDQCFVLEWQALLAVREGGCLGFPAR